MRIAQLEKMNSMNKMRMMCKDFSYISALKGSV